jgi:hypothetical protein
MGTRIDAETLAMLRESMTRYRQNEYKFERRTARLGKAPGYDPAAWRDYAAFGWLGLPLPEAQGGFDGDLAAVGALMEYVGGALALEPVFASSVLAGGLLARCGDRNAVQWLEAIAEGKAIFALAHAESPDQGQSSVVRATLAEGRLSGEKLVVLHGDVATHFLVTARTEGGDGSAGSLALARVEAGGAGVAVTPYALVDGRGAATCEFDGAPAAIVSLDANALLERTLDEARLALCSETLGAVRALNEATNAYLKTRKQFGRPIGSNQALQHRMVELLMLQEELQSVIEAACRACDGPQGRRVRAISAAAAHAATAARLCAHEAVQMHGGMGITTALPVSHYFKRLMVTARLLGDRDQYMRRFAAADAVAG